MNTFNKIITTSIFLALSTYTLAIDPNSTLPIKVESDSAILDDANGISIYKGNVIISQGFSRLEAESIHVTTNNRKIVEIKALGKPAHFIQQENKESPLTHGYGETIKYLANDHLLHLIGEAKIVQQENSFAGDQIEYDIVKRAIRARGDEKQGSRVKIHYQPRVQDDTPLSEKTSPSSTAGDKTSDTNSLSDSKNQKTPPATP